MKVLEITGLESGGAQKTVKELQQLLADLHVFYMNLRGYHWHIEGRNFFRLHEKYEELYDAVNDQIDEVAERILMLDASPENRFSEYLKSAKVKEMGKVTDGIETVKGVLEDIKVIIAQARVVAESADAISDAVTVGMMDEYLTGYEKDVWMLGAFLR